MSTEREARLRQLLEGSPYLGYLYSYPHKTAHRPLDPPLPLEPLWQDERRDALFLYIHVPFCAMRCGYCNLLSNKRRPRPGQVQGFLDALERQARAVRTALDECRFARFALGGGTPTCLSTTELGRVLEVAGRIMGADLPRIPACVEISPGTADTDKLALLRERGIDRVSVGIQSFEPRELGALGRQQSVEQIQLTLERVRVLGFPTLNVDLIYGIEGQDEASLLRSLEAAEAHRPEELYLYPLYVRPFTRLGQSQRRWDDQRLALYRAGRRWLLERGYRQLSMRMFRRADAPVTAGPPYRCQEDGMVGLACGARSYTERLHYSTPWAVSPDAVDALIEAYISRPPDSFARAEHGVRLDDEERRRRHVILSLLLAEGLDLEGYRCRFGSHAHEDLPELAALEPAGLARRRGERLVLTEAGLERSDLIGPWLRSDSVQALMDAYHLR